VNGPAVGLGASLATMCDIILISESAYICDPHVSVGVVAGDGGPVVWPLLTSFARAKEHLFLGDRIDAATCERIGLANRVLPPDELMPYALDLASPRGSAEAGAATDEAGDQSASAASGQPGVELRVVRRGGFFSEH